MSQLLNEKKIVEAIAELTLSTTMNEAVSEGSKLVSAYGKERKMSGAKSMAKLVRKMREKQNAYFETDRSSSLKDKYLKEAKKLEVQVDRAVEAVLR